MSSHVVTSWLNPWRSLRARFALVLGVTGLVLVFGAGAWVESQQRRQLEADLGQAAQRKAQLLARMLDQAVQQRLLQMRQLAGQPLLSSGLMEPGDQRQALEQLRANQPEFMWLALLDAKGQAEVATNAFLQGQPLAALPAFQRGRQRAHVGQPHDAGPLEPMLPRDRDGNPPRLLDLSVPVLDFDGKLLGVLLAELDWNWLQSVLQWLQDARQPEQVLALDAGGRVVMAWPPQAATVPPTLPRGSSAELLAWSDGRLYLTAAARRDGDARTAAGLDLTLVVRQDAEIAFAGARQLRHHLLQAGALAALAVMVMAAALAGAVARPLQRLADVATRLRRGEPVQFPETPTGHGDEVAELAATLRALDADVRQRMQQQAQAHDTLQHSLQALHEARDQLQRLNAELENRVQARTAQLLAANAELDSFAYAVSHDLRAPLRAMNGFSQALLEDHGPRLEGDAKLYLNQIILGSQRMGALIDGLLALSRSTRGDLRNEPVDLGALARQAFDELRAAEPQREVQLDLQGDLMARGDGRMLQAVMRNLVGNAWKYTAARAQALIRVSERLREGQRWFCVADNGAGFDMAHAGRLFQPFSRLHRADEFPGLGIGLATVQRIVRRHGGQILAEGRVGEGASVSFTLPQGPLENKDGTP